jgi:hypothetical protein
MAWKNLQQTTLVDAMLIEHEALKELDDVHELINWSTGQELKVYWLSFIPVDAVKKPGPLY